MDLYSSVIDHSLDVRMTNDHLSVIRGTCFDEIIQGRVVYGTSCEGGRSPNFDRVETSLPHNRQQHHMYKKPQQYK